MAEWIEDALRQYAADKVFVYADPAVSADEIIPAELRARYIADARRLSELPEQEDRFTEWTADRVFDYYGKTYFGSFFTDAQNPLIVTLNETGVQNKAAVTETLSGLPTVQYAVETAHPFDRVDVVITHEYSVTRPQYTVGLFGAEYFAAAVPVMTYADAVHSGGHFNYEEFCDVVYLYMTEKGLENPDAAMAALEKLDFVKTAQRGAVHYGVLLVEPMPGDVNANGSVGAEDARLALRIAVGLESSAQTGTTRYRRADLDGDGVVTASDARNILRMAVGLPADKS
ncbi:MAG: dockerin type I repeat-containing protein [Clostridia bacterium]|nr:dockerin type I repeat-containing protein [Clostridia bacterium]